MGTLSHRMTAGRESPLSLNGLYGRGDNVRLLCANSSSSVSERAAGALTSCEKTSTCEGGDSPGFGFLRQARSLASHGDADIRPFQSGRIVDVVSVYINFVHLSAWIRFRRAERNFMLSVGRPDLSLRRQLKCRKRRGTPWTWNRRFSG